MCDYNTSDLLLPLPLDYPVPPAGGILIAPSLRPPPPPLRDQFAEHAFDSIRRALAILKSDATNNNKFDFPSTPPYLEHTIANQRSAGSHSLYKDVNHSLPLACNGELMHHAFSIGDSQTIFNSLQHNQGLGSSLPYDHCSSEGVTRVGRYSVEERRERIKRYRSKRNQRNFHKKIKYECRKTLANGRRRIRGRFARNEETEECSQRWSKTAGVDDEDDDDAWINFLDVLCS